MAKNPSTSPGAASPVHALHDVLRNDVVTLNQTIVDRMQSPVPLVNQLGAYIVAAGGKRLRPLLTMAVAHMLGYTGVHHITLAAAVEFIHTATLLHDDVVDESNQRRGQPSANAMFGNQASVLVGDFLFTRAFELMVETQSLRVLGVLSKASSVIAQGEVMQLAAIGDISLTRQHYFDVIGAKTAALFAAAAEVGAIISTSDETLITAARAYGHHLGVAFQIADDVLDYQSTVETMGKNAGDDFREGKVTLPVVMALEKATSEERSFWQRTLVEGKQNDFDLNHAQKLLTQHDCLNDALVVARSEAEKAQHALHALPDTPLRQLLADTALFSVTRQS